MVKAGYFLTFILILVLYTSCGDASLFSTADSSSYKIIFDSHQNGSIIQAGENITLKVTNPDNSTASTKPTSLTVALKNAADGQKVAESTLQPIQLDEKLTLNFTAIKTGQYLLSLILNDEDTILTETKLTIFYTDGQYIINSIKSLPSLINPNAHVLLSAELSLPERANPYLKWSSNGVLLNKGFLKDGLNEIDWQAPKEEGVYTVTLEVFPVRPVEGDQVKYSSPLVMNTELYVTSQKEVSERDLFPIESYFALFHLNDNLKDSVQEWKKITRGRNPLNHETAVLKTDGSYPEDKLETETAKETSSSNLTEAGEATAIGELKPISFGKDMGYQLNGTSGIAIPYLIIPTAQGSVQPFTMSIGLTFDELQPGAAIVTLGTEDEQFALKLYLNSTFSPEALLTKNGTGLIVSSGIETLKIGQLYFLSLSIYPEKDGFHADWFLDGFLYSSQFIAQSLDGISVQGKTVVGGEQGFKGVIDELGVYYLTTQKQPSIDPYLFRDAMQRKFSSSLVFANGFDSLILPSELKTEGEVHTDGINLQLASQAFFTLSDLSIKKEPLWVFIEFSKSTILSCAWLEKGLTVKTELKLGNGKNPETNNIIQTKVLMLKIDSNHHATVNKLLLQDSRSLPNNQLRLLSEDNRSKRTWETISSLVQPVINNQNTSKQDFSLIITNAQSAPLYIDNILVYTE